MIEIKTKEKLNFNSPQELLNFMDLQSDEDFFNYAKQYCSESKSDNKGFIIIKRNEKSSFQKVVYQNKYQGN